MIRFAALTTLLPTFALLGGLLALAWFLLVTLPAWWDRRGNTPSAQDAQQVSRQTARQANEPDPDGSDAEVRGRLRALKGYEDV